jgi:hypothetical protein
MKISDLINNSDFIEPETIRMLFPTLSSIDRQKIQVLWLLNNRRGAYEDFEVFEKVSLVLNNIDPDINKTEGTLPEYIWVTIKVIKDLRPDVELSHEVLEYIKYIFDSNGYKFYPPGIGLNDKENMDQLKLVAKTGPFPLKDDERGIQANRYKRITDYASMESN